MRPIWKKQVGVKTSLATIVTATAIFAGAVYWMSKEDKRGVAEWGERDGSIQLAGLANWNSENIEPGFKPVQLMRPLPAIKEFPVVTAAAAQGKLGDAELVLGVEIDGNARAYPINMLTGPQREILNDQLGQLPIAATW